MSDIPSATKDVFRTAWEIDPSVIIDMAADRAPYIDQSQSTTLSVSWPTTHTLVCLELFPVRKHTDGRLLQQDLHVRGWMRGLKTGIYYLRCRAPTFPLPYGVPGAQTDGHLRPIVTLDDRDVDDRDEDDDSDLPPPLEPATPVSPAAPSDAVASVATIRTTIPTSAIRTHCDGCEA